MKRRRPVSSACPVAGCAVGRVVGEVVGVVGVVVLGAIWPVPTGCQYCWKTPWRGLQMSSLGSAFRAASL